MSDHLDHAERPDDGLQGEAAQRAGQRDDERQSVGGQGAGQRDDERQSVGGQGAGQRGDERQGVRLQGDGHLVSERWTRWREQVDLDEFHTRWTRREAEGAATHGEADFIERLAPSSVLDAGCGMGRVAIELARRGVDVEGADLDDDLLEFARRDAPHIRWHHADLATMRLGRRYSMVAMPGNVMIFCRPSQRADVVATAVHHLEPGGLLVAGFSLEPQRGVPGYDPTVSDVLTLAEYDAHCEAAGLVLQSRFATWEGAPYESGPYAVSIHQHQLWR